MISEVKKTVDIILAKPSRSSPFDFCQVSAANYYLIKISNGIVIGNLHITILFLFPNFILTDRMILEQRFNSYEIMEPDENLFQKFPFLEWFQVNICNLILF